MSTDGDIEIPITAVMPRTSGTTKKLTAKRMGANVILHGDSLSESAHHAENLAAQSEWLLLPVNAGLFSTCATTSYEPLMIAGLSTHV